MLIRILLPSQEFLDFLNLRGKFPERVNMVNGCLVAYKIRDDPNGRVCIFRIKDSYFSENKKFIGA